LGRGNASGQGTYAGKGLKGQKARAGGGPRVGFEGGQLPLIRRMARKRGFTNIFRVEYQTVNLSRLARFPAGTEVTPESLLEARLIKSRRAPVKVLGGGDIQVPVTVRAHKFSETARRKIEAAGGKAEEVTDGD
jgi:large subunit ribosomal protein L15